MKRFIVLFLLNIFIIGCKKETNSLNEDAIDKFVMDMDVDISDYNSILFIPLEGCGSCIEKGVEFYKNYCDDSGILYVICTHKPFAYDYLKNIDRPNVIVDQEGLAIKNKILTTAPVVYI